MLRRGVVEQRPEPTLVVRLTSEAPELLDAVDALAESTPAPVTVRRDGVRPLDRVQTAHEAIASRVAADLSDVSSEVDVRTGSVVLFVSDQQRRDALRVAELGRTFDIPVRVGRTSQPYLRLPNLPSSDAVVGTYVCHQAPSQPHPKPTRRRSSPSPATTPVVRASRRASGCLRTNARPRTPSPPRPPPSHRQAATVPGCESNGPPQSAPLHRLRRRTPRRPGRRQPDATTLLGRARRQRLVEKRLRRSWRSTARRTSSSIRSG